MTTPAQTGLPFSGPTPLMTCRGVVGHGLKLAGTAVLSGAAGLTTTAKQLSFVESDFPAAGNGRVPRWIMIRGLSGTVAIKMGRGTITMAADTFSPILDCTDLFLGYEEWYVTGSGSISIEYIIGYT